MREGEEHRAKHKIGVLGMARAAAADWRHIPKATKRSPQPYCHGTPAERRARYKAVMALTAARREACRLLLAGVGYKKSGFVELEGKVVLPNELQVLRWAEEKAAREEAKGA